MSGYFGLSMMYWVVKAKKKQTDTEKDFPKSVKTMLMIFLKTPL